VVGEVEQEEHEAAGGRDQQEPHPQRGRLLPPGAAAAAAGRPHRRLPRRARGESRISTARSPGRRHAARGLETFLLFSPRLRLLYGLRLPRRVAPLQWE
jgi:hypothetical protein